MLFLTIVGALLLGHQATGFPFMQASSFSTEGDNWAVIVAGSDGWYNYRHQADAAHAYQLLVQNGFPESNIILMMADDVAHHPNNIHPGVLINQPGGPNVYKGIHIDYRGRDVTPENFQKVLLGEATHAGNNKTLGSGPQDNVFVYFVDHGGVGLIAFPKGNILTSHELARTMSAMHRRRLYKRLVFFVEACEGGSMFDGLLRNDTEVYAHTATGTNQPSFATYWDPEYRTFLGDAYSVAWMEDSDKHFSLHNPRPESLERQFWNVYERIKTQSIPHQYGDIELGKAHMVEEFQAYKLVDGTLSLAADSVDTVRLVAAYGNGDNVMVSSRDAKIYALKQDMLQNSVKQDIALDQLENEYRLRQEARDRFVNLAGLVAGPSAMFLVDKPVGHVLHHECLSESLRVFHKDCHSLDEYHLPYTKLLSHLCNAGYSAQDVAGAVERNHLCAV